MPVRTYQTSITVPAGTLSTAPMKQAWLTEDNVVQWIELEIPPGHNGFTGIRVMKGDTQLMPWGVGTWVTANNYVNRFDVDDYVPTNDVSIEAYNTGAYPHTFYLRMAITDLADTSTTNLPGESSALAVESSSATPNSLSPDALLGPQTASQLTTGQVTADQVSTSDLGSLSSPPTSMPTG